VELFSDPIFWTLVLFLGSVLLGFPIAVALGSVATFVVWYWDLGIAMISFNFFANIVKFPLLAIPYFILSGIIMEKSGIAEKLIDLINECVGSITGGLALGAVLVATFWGAISGSGPATVAALGVILIPGMVKAGYDKPFATATVCASSGLAIIIPPSIAFIVYAIMTSCSVGGILAAGVFPGLVMSACICVSVYLTCRKKGYRGRPRKGRLLKSLKDAFWALMSPIIILGGIYGGVFTPTEAAAVSVFYGLAVGILIYRKITLRDLYSIFAETCSATSVVMLLVACGGMYAWATATVGLVDKLSSLMLGFSSNQYVVLFIINIILLFMGMILDGISIYTIFVPLLMPIMAQFGWNPIWFGVVMTINIAIGQVTPPVAQNLFVGSKISGLSIEELTPPVLPLIVASVVAMAIICAFPQITLFLPGKLGFLE
jgi:C4-dicarboxylate transporter DctM subunit